MQPFILGLCGYAQVGKTTTALAVKDILEKEGREVVILPFAGPLKLLAMEYFGWDGKKDDRSRKLLQSLGTDVARAWEPDFWVRKWAELARPLIQAGACIIADDIRFNNECARLQLWGGYVVRLNHQRGVDAAAKCQHASERPFELQADLDYAMADFSPTHIASYILDARMRHFKAYPVDITLG